MTSLVVTPLAHHYVISPVYKRSYIWYKDEEDLYWSHVVDIVETD